jgi:hypothetical protein
VEAAIIRDVAGDIDHRRSGNGLLKELDVLIGDLDDRGVIDEVDFSGEQVGHVFNDYVHLKRITCLDGDAVLNRTDARRGVSCDAGVDGQRRAGRGGAARSNLERNGRYEQRKDR